MSTSVGTSGPTTAAPRPSTLTSSSTPQPPPLPSWTQPVLDIVAARKDTKRGRRRRGSDQPRDIRHQVGKKVYLLTESETALVQEAYERQCAEWRRATEALRASSRAHPSGDLRQPDFNDPASAVPSKKRGQKDPISRDGPSTKRARKSAKGSALSQRIDPQSTTASNASFQDVKGLEEYRLNDMPHAEVYYVPTFVSTELAEEWYQNLQKLDTWYRPMLRMYGRTFPQSRQIAAYATSPNLKLRYSGQDTTMNYPYPPVLQDIQDQVEKMLGVTFNHCMLNWYEDGSVHIGSHRDNLENRVIASVSVGAERTFHMEYAAPRPRATKGKAAKASDAADDNDNVKASKKKWLLKNGSLVVMQGETQRYWKHAIPKEPKVKGGRISLTFRQLVY